MEVVKLRLYDGDEVDFFFLFIVQIFKDFKRTLTGVRLKLNVQILHNMTIEFHYRVFLKFSNTPGISVLKHWHKNQSFRLAPEPLRD